MPMLNSSKGTALEGRKLCDFMPKEDDQLDFAKCLQDLAGASEGFDNVHRTTVVHVNLRNQMGHAKPVRLYCASHLDLFAERPCTLVGICESETHLNPSSGGTDPGEELEPSEDESESASSNDMAVSLLIQKLHLPVPQMLFDTLD